MAAGESSKKRHRDGNSPRHDRNKLQEMANPTAQRKDLRAGRTGILISCTPHREQQAFEEAAIMLTRYSKQYEAARMQERAKQSLEADLKGENEEAQGSGPNDNQTSELKEASMAAEETERSTTETRAAAKTTAEVPSAKEDPKGISNALQDELKDIRDLQKKLFTRIDTGANGSLFMCVNNAAIDRERLVEDALREAQACGSPNARHCIRIMPIHATCAATPGDAAKAAVDVVKEHFPAVVGDATVTYAISLQRQLETGVHRNDYIPAIAKAIEEFEPKYKVDIGKPDVTLIVEVVKTACCIGSFRPFFELAKMNLREAACSSQTGGKGGGDEGKGKEAGVQKEGMRVKEKSERNDAKAGAIVGNVAGEDKGGDTAEQKEGDGKGGAGKPADSTVEGKNRESAEGNDTGSLADAREVCLDGDKVSCEEATWKARCLKRWRSLETDKELWKLIDKYIDPNSPDRWRRIYPEVTRSSQWTLRLEKNGKSICNVVAHQISGKRLGAAGLPRTINIERRFNIVHLQVFILPDASILYFEPESDGDKSAFDGFIEYLDERKKAGLGLEENRRFIFIPPCEYTRTQVEYQGRSLLGAVQSVYVAEEDNT